VFADFFEGFHEKEISGRSAKEHAVFLFIVSLSHVRSCYISDVFNSDKIQRLIQAQLEGRPLSALLSENMGTLVAGKMLRARLAQAIAAAVELPDDAALRIGAAVELVHGASLLHDDVIDGGVLRRGEPAFWKTHGANGAVLLGDLLVFEAMALLKPVNGATLLPLMIELGREVCEAEACQELLWRGTSGRWDQCLQIARGKTGALFAFAACAPAFADLKLQAALKEAGYLLGTAYQLYDDLCDESSESKTAGTDLARGKLTAMSVEDAPPDLAVEIEALLARSKPMLHPWPHVASAWDAYLRETISLGRM
jgi:geranylgeranyl pyrophosphate synthase